MARDAEPGEVVAILRALAVCHTQPEVDLQIRESSNPRPLPGSADLHLDVRVHPRDAFWTAVQGLQDAGAIDTGRLFQRHIGPGVVEQVAQDRAIEFARTLLLCADAGHEVRIEDHNLGRPSGVAPEDHELVFTVRVKADPYYGLRPHQF